MGKDKLAYGDFYEYQYERAPWCCIYVGLTANESHSFRDVFTHFAESYDIHKVVKHYKTYSGPGCANYMSDHVACSAFCIPTASIMAYHDRPETAELRLQSLQSGEWDFAFGEYCFWPTNASRIIAEEPDLVAPYTGCIHMVSYDKQYSPKDFKMQAELLERAVRTNWPDRPVEAFIYEGNKPSILISPSRTGPLP